MLCRGSCQGMRHAEITHPHFDKTTMPLIEGLYARCLHCGYVDWDISKWIIL